MGSGGDLAPSLGGRHIFSADPRFLNDVFWGKNFLFLVIDQIFQIFPFFSQIFPIFAMLNVISDPFFTRKTPFFTLFLLSRVSENTTSLNIGEDQCMGRPPPQILGGPSPLGLRPWAWVRIMCDVTHISSWGHCIITSRIQWNLFPRPPCNQFTVPFDPPIPS